jgi:hypothetical protein
MQTMAIGASPVPALLMLVLATVAIAQSAMPARPCMVGMLGLVAGLG